ncbi:terminase small subunit [Pantoea sp. RSPAM1]|uniref:terminase small subunit n=1 Tax=Pantoea sp. RSPAM1 TaxID=2675223 RepID=UPI00315D70BC
MRKPDWKLLQSQFAAAFASTGISPREWCEQHGLNYDSARRYIKKNVAKKNAQKKTAHNRTEPAQQRLSMWKGFDSTCAAEDPKRSAFCAGLSDKESIFVSSYLQSRDKYDAYLKAGYSGSDRHARLLYRKPAIARAINLGIEMMSEQAILTGRDILRHWHEIATADPNEISQLRRTCCRYCWGENFLYQWGDIAEYDKAAEKAAKDGKPAPEYGGLGFVANDDPNPDCPRCGGEGLADVFLADTRDVIGTARRLIASVKKTKFGIEVMTRDQDAALKNLAAFHNLASSEQDRELRLLEIERVRLSNEKIKAEIEHLRNGANGNDQIIIHNSLKPPGAE